MTTVWGEEDDTRPPTGKGEGERPTSPRPFLGTLPSSSEPKSQSGGDRYTYWTHSTFNEVKCERKKFYTFPRDERDSVSSNLHTSFYSFVEFLHCRTRRLQHKRVDTTSCVFQEEEPRTTRVDSNFNRVGHPVQQSRRFLCCLTSLEHEKEWTKLR